MSQLSGTFFHRFADTFDTIYDGKRSRAMQWIDRRFRRDMFVRFTMTFELLGDLEGKTVLDVGCGSGPYMAEALRRGADRLTGIDPARRMLDLARERVNALDKVERVRFLEGTFPESTPDEVHDVAIVMGVMDYVDDSRAFVSSLADCVRGRAVLSFPSTHWLRTPIRRVRYRLRRCPVYFYDERRIAQLMDQAGVSDYDVHKIRGAGMDYVVCIRGGAN